MRSARDALSDRPTHSDRRRVMPPHIGLSGGPLHAYPGRETSKTHDRYLRKACIGGGSHHGERHDGQHACHCSQHLRGVQCRVTRPHCAACGQRAFHRSAPLSPSHDRTTMLPAPLRHMGWRLSTRAGRLRHAGACCRVLRALHAPAARQPAIHRCAARTVQRAHARARTPLARTRMQLLGHRQPVHLWLS